MQKWDCIQPHIDKWQEMVGVDPFNTKEFITALNKQTGLLDRLANITNSQIGKGVIYVAMMLELCAINIQANVKIMGQDTSVPIGKNNYIHLFQEPTKEQIAIFLDQHIEVCKDADVFYKGYKDLRIEVKDGTGKFRAGATSNALASSNRLLRPLSLCLNDFFAALNNVELNTAYWQESAFKRKKTSKKQILTNLTNIFKNIHIQIDALGWGASLESFFSDHYKDNYQLKLSTIFYLLLNARHESTLESLRTIGKIVQSVEELIANLQTLSSTIVEDHVDELWLVKQDGYKRVSNVKNIGNYVKIVSISTGRAVAQMK